MTQKSENKGKEKSLIKEGESSSTKKEFSLQGNPNLITSVTDFIKRVSTLVKPYFMEDNDKTIFYRGQSNRSWKLRPSLLQDEKTPSHEKKIVRELISRQASAFSDDKSIFDYLVRAQHFGLPTRLLDVTRMPLIALYFGCSDENEIDQNGKAFILTTKESELKSFESDSATLFSNLARLSEEEKQELKENAHPLLQAVRREKPSFQENISLEKLQKPIFVLPKQNNERIIAQQGIFLLFGLDPNPLDESSKDFHIQSLEIASNAKGSILKDLEILGIHKSTVFPGIERCAEYLKEGLKRLETDAEHGDPEAQFQLGLQYANGFERKQDHRKAQEYWEKAAHHGYAKAQHNLGALYYNAEGVEENLHKAREYFELAAKQDDSKAQFALGLIYYLGKGVRKDFIKAREYFEKAAQQNHVEAQAYLGIIYATGRGAKIDFIKAREYFEKAAEQGDATAQYSLGVTYEHGEGVKKDLGKAREYYEKAAKQGLQSAQYNLAIMYTDGEGGEKDLSKAREYYIKAAQQGYAPAQFNIAIMYENGEGGEKDLRKAREYYKKAAKQGHVGAQFNLGFIYENGDGVAKNLTKAREYYRKAAKHSDQDAIKALSRLDKLEEIDNEGDEKEKDKKKQ